MREMRWEGSGGQGRGAAFTDINSIFCIHDTHLMMTAACCVQLASTKTKDMRHSVIGARTVRGIRMVQADTYTFAKREGHCGAGRDTHKHVVAHACKSS
jgi:hypothetical protein